MNSAECWTGKMGNIPEGFSLQTDGNLLLVCYAGGDCLKLAVPGRANVIGDNTVWAGVVNMEMPERQVIESALAITERASAKLRT